MNNKLTYAFTMTALSAGCVGGALVLILQQALK